MVYISHHSPGYEQGPMPDQFPALFQPAAEVPSSDFAYRYWEDESIVMLMGYDPLAIARVIRYRLFRDQDTPRRILQNRNEATVENFLINIVAEQEAARVATLSHFQKVEEIIRRVRPATPPLIPWSWFPSRLAGDSSPLDIAAAIDKASYMQFIRVPFEELVRFSLGYRAIPVEWFLHQHTNLYIQLLAYLKQHPDEIESYMDVEKALRGGSPFARRAVARCLISLMPGANLDIPEDQILKFEFIASPIQRLLKHGPGTLMEVLQVLCVLAIRFRQTYLHTARMDWKRRFDVDISFFQRLLDATSAEDFAQSLTSADAAAFSVLTTESIMANDKVVQQYIVRWEALALSVWEIASALPNWVEFMHACIQALFSRRNYHSVMAIFSGLHKYSVTLSQQTHDTRGFNVVTIQPALPPSLVYLMNPAGNYAAYCQRFNALPGIPFLFPHIAHAKEKGPAVLQHMFEEAGLH